MQEQRAKGMDNTNLMWYQDENIAIGFNHRPNTHMLEPLPSMTQKEKDLIEEYPFINCTSLKVYLFDKPKMLSHKFTIPKSFRWDGATIPCLIWFIIGSKTNPKFRIPSLIHDYMCNNKYCVGYDRAFSTEVFKALLKVAGVGEVRRNVMCFFVDLWQRFQKGWE